MSYTEISSFSEIEDFEREVTAAGGGLVGMRIPVVLDNGKVDESVPPDAGDGADPADPVSARHGIEEIFRLNPGEQNVQVRVEKLKSSGPGSQSDWVSFDEALMFLGPVD